MTDAAPTGDTIESLDREIAHMETWTGQSPVQMRQIRNSLTSLPPEILVHILLMLKERANTQEISYMPFGGIKDVFGSCRWTRLMGACTHIWNVAVSSSVLWTSVDLSHDFRFVRLSLTRANGLPLNVYIETRLTSCPTDRDLVDTAVIAQAGCINTFLALAARAPARTRAQSRPAWRQL
jgi:hypothetical protein